MTEPVNRQTIHDELERARETFHRLLEFATEADLRKASNGTRWDNEELLFHMLFGYLLVRALLQHFDFHQQQLTLSDGS